MPGGGFSPSDDFDETRPAGTDYGYDIDRWCTSNLQHTCNAYAAEHYEMSNDPDASEDDFGRHDFITLKQQSSKPNLTGSTNRTGLYTKATGVYLEKADGTEIQILDFTTERSGVDNDVPSGEIILFEKDTAVTGYILQTDKDDMVVYITKGSGAGGESGGTDKTGGTWILSGLTADNHTHGAGSLAGPSHTHTVDIYASDYTGSILTLGGNTLNYLEDTADQVDWNTQENRYLGASRGKRETTAAGGTGAVTGNTGTPSTNGITSTGAWRPLGRNFTRQARN